MRQVGYRLKSYLGSHYKENTMNGKLAKLLRRSTQHDTSTKTEYKDITVNPTTGTTIRVCQGSRAAYQGLKKRIKYIKQGGVR